MGFFKDIAEIGRGALAAGTFGISEIGFGLAEELGVDLSDPFGTQKAVEGLRAAGRLEDAIQLENLAFRRQIFGETAEVRERAGVAGEALLAKAQTPLAESEDFQRDLKESLKQQRISFGAFGLGDSSAFAQAAGETTAGLTAKERQQRVGILQFLAGGAETGISGALGAQQLSTQAGLTRAQTLAGIGATQAAGQKDIIQTGLDILGTGGALAFL